MATTTTPPPPPKKPTPPPPPPQRTSTEIIRAALSGGAASGTAGTSVRSGETTTTFGTGGTSTRTSGGSSTYTLDSGQRVTDVATSGGVPIEFEITPPKDSPKGTPSTYVFIPKSVFGVQPPQPSEKIDLEAIRREKIATTLKQVGYSVTTDKYGSMVADRQGERNILTSKGSLITTQGNTTTAYGDLGFIRPRLDLNYSPANIEQVRTARQTLGQESYMRDYYEGRTSGVPYPTSTARLYSSPLAPYLAEGRSIKEAQRLYEKETTPTQYPTAINMFGNVVGNKNILPSFANLISNVSGRSVNEAIRKRAEGAAGKRLDYLKSLPDKPYWSSSKEDPNAFNYQLYKDTGIAVGEEVYAFTKNPAMYVTKTYAFGKLFQVTGFLVSKFIKASSNLISRVAPKSLLEINLKTKAFGLSMGKGKSFNIFNLNVKPLGEVAAKKGATAAMTTGIFSYQAVSIGMERPQDLFKPSTYVQQATMLGFYGLTFILKGTKLTSQRVYFPQDKAFITTSKTKPSSQSKSFIGGKQYNKGYLVKELNVFGKTIPYDAIPIAQRTSVKGVTELISPTQVSERFKVRQSIIETPFKSSKSRSVSNPLRVVESGKINAMTDMPTLNIMNIKGTFTKTIDFNQQPKGNRIKPQSITEPFEYSFKRMETITPKGIDAFYGNVKGKIVKTELVERLKFSDSMSGLTTETFLTWGKGQLPTQNPLVRVNKEYLDSRNIEGIYQQGNILLRNKRDIKTLKHETQHHKSDLFKLESKMFNEITKNKRIKNELNRFMSSKTEIDYDYGSYIKDFQKQYKGLKKESAVKRTGALLDETFARFAELSPRQQSKYPEMKLFLSRSYGVTPKNIRIRQTSMSRVNTELKVPYQLEQSTTKEIISINKRGDVVSRKLPFYDKKLIEQIPNKIDIKEKAVYEYNIGKNKVVVSAEGEGYGVKKGESIQFFGESTLGSYSDYGKLTGFQRTGGVSAVKDNIIYGRSTTKTDVLFDKFISTSVSTTKSRGTNLAEDTYFFRTQTKEMQLGKKTQRVGSLEIKNLFLREPQETFYREIYTTTGVGGKLRNQNRFKPIKTQKITPESIAQAKQQLKRPTQSQQKQTAQLMPQESKIFKDNLKLSSQQAAKSIAKQVAITSTIKSGLTKSIAKNILTTPTLRTKQITPLMIKSMDKQLSKQNISQTNIQDIFTKPKVSQYNAAQQSYRTLQVPSIIQGVTPVTRVSSATRQSQTEEQITQQTQISVPQIITPTITTPRQQGRSGFNFKPTIPIEQQIIIMNPFKQNPFYAKKKKLKKLKSRKGRYTPSLIAVGQNIFGRKPKNYTGLTIRPISF